MAFLAGRLALQPGLEAEHEVTLTLRDTAGQRGGMGRGVDELLGRAGGVGEPDVGEGEVLVLGNRLLEQFPAVRGAKLLEQIAALLVEGTGLGRRRADGDLAGRRGRLTRGRGRDADDEDPENAGRAAPTSHAHGGLLRMACGTGPR